MIAQRSWLRIACLACLGAALLVWGVSNPGLQDAVEQPSTPALPEVERIADPREATPDEPSGAHRSRAELELGVAVPLSDINSERNSRRPTGEGVLTGRVRDLFGSGQGAALLILQRGSERREARSGASGAFLFENLAPGHYRLFVEPSSLPGGVLAPWRQSVSTPYTGTPSAIHSTSFVLRSKERLEIDLLVQRAAKLRGSLQDEFGQAISGAIVGLSSREGVERNARSNEQGFFEVANLHPGEYDVQVLRGVTGAASAGSYPLPTRVLLEAGEERELAPLIFGAGGYVVRGRVLDELGQPVEGLLLVCAEVRAAGDGLRLKSNTDAEGRFAFGRLPDVGVVVQVAAEAESTPGSSYSVLSAFEPVQLAFEELREEYDLGELRVGIAERFQVSGRVEVDVEWVRDQGLDPYVLELTAPTTLAESADGLRTQRIDARSGAFQWSCALPQAPLELVVSFRAHTGEVHTRQVSVSPRARAREDVVVHFP